MMAAHLPQFSVKPSNEAKTITRTLKYLALVVLAISIVIVSALFVRLSFSSSEPSTKPTHHGVASLEKLKAAQLDNEPNYIIHVNVELDQPTPDSMNVGSKPVHSMSNDTNKNVVDIRFIPKNELNNTYLYQSTESTSLNPKLKPYYHPHILKADTEIIYLKSNKPQETSYIGNLHLPILSTPEQKNQSHDPLQSSVLSKAFPLLNSKKFPSESSESHVKPIIQKKEFIPGPSHKLFNPRDSSQEVIISPPVSNENQVKGGNVPEKLFPMDPLTDIKNLLPVRNGLKESESSLFPTSIHSNDFQLSPNLNELMSSPNGDNLFFPLNDGLSLPDFFSSNLENTVNSFFHDFDHFQSNEPNFNFIEPKLDISDNIEEKYDSATVEGRLEGKLFDEISSNMFDLF